MKCWLILYVSHAPTTLRIKKIVSKDRKTTHRLRWGCRGTRRRSICTPRSCGSSSWRRDNRSAASSSVSSPTQWWCPVRGRFGFFFFPTIVWTWFKSTVWIFEHLLILVLVCTNIWIYILYLIQAYLMNIWMIVEPDLSPSCEYLNISWILFKPTEWTFEYLNICLTWSKPFVYMNVWIFVESDTSPLYEYLNILIFVSPGPSPS